MNEGVSRLGSEMGGLVTEVREGLLGSGYIKLRMEPFSLSSSPHSCGTTWTCGQLRPGTGGAGRQWDTSAAARPRCKRCLY